MENCREIQTANRFLGSCLEAGLKVNDLRKALPKHPTLEWQYRDMKQVQGIVIHHSGGWEKATAAGIAYWCIEKREFVGMPYSLYIHWPNGEIDWCLDFEQIGWHCKGCNDSTFGVALAGSWVDKDPPLSMIDSLARLIDVLWDFFMLEVNNALWVNPHFDVSQTQCPGRVWEAYQEYE